MVISLFMYLTIHEDDYQRKKGEKQNTNKVGVKGIKRERKTLDKNVVRFVLSSFHFQSNLNAH